jgi:hypothetical protein
MENPRKQGYREILNEGTGALTSINFVLKRREALWIKTPV